MITFSSEKNTVKNVLTGDYSDCSFFSKSIRTDEVEIGTYIIMSEANGKFDSTEQVIEDIKQAFFKG